MVVFSEYPQDARVRREAEALVESGMSVDVICLKNKNAPRREIVEGVHVLRLPLQRIRASRTLYVWQYCAFLVMSLLKVTVLHIRKRYSLVHVHNMPNILVTSALVPGFFGAKVMLDIHDPMPEVYLAKYPQIKTRGIMSLLRLEERFSIWFADYVITPNIAFRKLFISRGCPASKIGIVMNSPQEKVFRRGKVEAGRQRRDDEFILMCHGTIAERNGLGTALEALTHVRNQIPNLVFEVFGSGDFVPVFLQRVNELGLRDIVRYHGNVSLSEIAKAITRIDVGIVPNGRSRFSNINMPTRVFEYLCLEKPVIFARTEGVLDYFNDTSAHLFEPGNPESLARAILDVYRDRARAKTIVKRGTEVYRSHRWELEKARLVTIVTDLVEGRAPTGNKEENVPAAVAK
jgi:glycosyltransferase involved in cell wall biosynthesis